jgi:hypothetical protein
MCDLNILGIGMEALIHLFWNRGMIGGATPVGDGSTQVEVVVVDALPCTDCIHVNEAEPRPGDASNGDASAPGFLRGPGSCLPGDTAPGDTIPSLGSSVIVDSWANELGLLGYPRVPPPPASLR